MSSNMNILNSTPLPGSAVTALSDLAGSPAGKLQKTADAAKNFEGLLLQQLLSSMRKTVPDSGLLSDGQSQQMQDIFWMYLGRDIGQQGSLGIWKQLESQLTDHQSDEPAPRHSTMERNA